MTDTNKVDAEPVAVVDKSIPSAEIQYTMNVGDDGLPDGTELVLASALAALRAQLDAVKSYARKEMSRGDERTEECIKLRAQLEQAQADAARLRAKVQELVALLDEATAYTSCASWSPSLTQEMNAAINAARAALGSATRSADSSEPFCNDDLTPNHVCGGRMVHLPRGEQCDKCGGEA